jgi:hypothetical protein
MSKGCFPTGWKFPGLVHPASEEKNFAEKKKKLNKLCCLRCSPSTCCPHLVSTVTGEHRRLGCGPGTHLVRGGPSSGLAGLGRTGLSGSSLPVPLGPGPAILHARSPSETGPNRAAAPTGAARRHGLLPPTALPCACPSVPGVSARFEVQARATN